MDDSRKALLRPTLVWTSCWLSLLVPAAARAQALSCGVPADLPRPRPDTPDDRNPRRVLPTASYTLAISWAPQYCRENGDRPGSALQCGGGNRFGFVLHGLWPDGPGKVWPQYCRPVELLSEATLRRHLCATPSVQLLQHEYAKHGSCMVGTADDYFRRSTGLYATLRYPDMTALSRRRGLTVGSFAAAFARANPRIPRQAIRVTVKPGGWLDELWLCADRQFRFARCRTTQDGGARASTKLRIWRGA